MDRETKVYYSTEGAKMNPIAIHDQWYIPLPEDVSGAGVLAKEETQTMAPTAK